jgi:transcriptional regulator with XRE-family HTH domain
MTTTPTLDSFGARLALIRQSARMNMKEAAKAAGVPAATWRAWELAGSLPHDYVGTCRKVAAAFGIDPQWVMVGPGSADGGTLNINRKSGRRPWRPGRLPQLAALAA